MDTHGETWLIYNGASGSHDDDALRAMVDAMGAAGYAPTKVVDCKDGTPDAAEANRGGLGLVAVHGGDGTLSEVSTRLARRDAPADALPSLALVPMGYMGDPTDIANMNLFLASDESRYVTGTELVVDGGYSAMTI